MSSGGFEDINEAAVSDLKIILFHHWFVLVGNNILHTCHPYYRSHTMGFFFLQFLSLKRGVQFSFNMS